MALGSEAPTSFKHYGHVTAALLLIAYVTLTQSAPTTYDEIEARRTDLTDYFNDPNGCYYNYQHYEEGDRIMTNEPCLNCTCHNRMLMCYLRVCPFSKAIGQDCTVQKSPDQCCPTISCPEVPVHLLTSSTTQKPTTTTEVGWRDNYGCMMNDNEFYPDGAQVPSDLKKPCELCYCIRNRTACVMQECTLHVEGCRPVYQEGVCCPVRYDCDYENEKSTTTAPQISGGLVFSTTSAPFDCRVNNDIYRDGESIAMVSEKPCQHCYCMRGDIVCAVQDCGEPLRGKHCTPETPPAGQCCPTSYQCANETISSDEIITIQPASQSDTDENEAEKYPSNEDIYDKLGEHQPSQDDTSNVESDHAYTTPAYNNEISSDGTSDQTTNKNEEIKNSFPAGDNHSVVEKPNILPSSDNVNKINEENKQDISSNKPELTNQVNDIGTESHQTKYGSTDKPVEPTLIDEAQPTESLPDDTPLNENIVIPTTQTTPSEINNVKINKENNDSKSPVENTSQNDLISNVPVVTTDHSLESETQSSNINDNLQGGIQQTDTPSIVEKEPIKSNNDEQQIPGQYADTKPQTETTFNENQDPPKQSNEENTDSVTEENKIQTGSPSSEDIEQTTQKLTQHDTEKSPLEESNTQTETLSNNGQNSLDKNNEDITQLPQEEISSHTENPSGQNVPNNDKPQAENELSTNIPKVENESTEQNNLSVDRKPQVENQPESQNKPIELNQDSLQENTSPTEIPKAENEPTEQNNNIPVENKPQNENQPESQNIPTEQNQDSLQENVSPTEILKIENEPTEENKLPVETQTESQNAPVGQNQSGSLPIENESSTEIPKVENEPTEQNNNMPVENKPQTENQPESQNAPTEQSQDSLHEENILPTELPSIENEPTELNNLLVDGKPQAEIQPESQTKPIELNQDSLQENASPTEIPKIENEPTKQNNDIPVKNKPQNENQPESQNIPTEKNQDSLQENVSPTEIPKVENEPTEENKLPVENQPESQNAPIEQNQGGNLPIENESSTEIPKVENEPIENDQDGLPVENESSTEIPKVENEPTEQNNLQVENKPQTENQPESQNVPTEKIQDNLQENVSPTEIPKVENEPNENNQDSLPVENSSSTEIPEVENKPTEQNNVPVENQPQTENQPESQNVPIKQNQDSLQENILPTEIPKIENEPTEQNNLSVENKPQTENQSELQNVPTEQNQGSLQENVSLTEISQTEFEPTEQNNISVENKPQTENQPESQNTPTEQNQDSLQENASPTKIPQVENEPTEQSNIIEENKPHTENQPESQNASTEQNQDNLQENESPTEIPKIGNDQNNLLVNNKSQTETQPEFQNIPVEQNQNNPQIINVSSTEIPKVENETIEPSKPILESSTQTVRQPESDKIPVEQNKQGASQVENISPTEIPSKLNEPQSENITPIKPTAPVVLPNDVSTEQPIEDNNIFVVSPTSPPLFSQNQVKGEESTSVPNDNNNNEEYSSTEKNVATIIENSQPSVDDKTSPAENINSDNISTITSTEVTPENNASPQTNDENTEQTTETKPVENEINSNIPNDVSNSPVNSHEQIPTNEEHNDNRFGSNETNNVKPTFAPITETNYDVNSETTNQSILVDDSSSQENQQDNEHSVDKENQSTPGADSIEHQNASQTETSAEVGTSENENPLSADEHLNDVTTSLPQQQIADNNAPVKSENVDSSEHTTTQDETKTPNLPENNIPEKSTNNQLPTEISEIQHSNEISNLTEPPVSGTSNVEQSTTTHPSKQNNKQTQNENVNEILDQTTAYPDILSDDKNKFNTPGLNQNNEENVTPLSENIENDTSAQDVDKKPVVNTNKDVSTEIESTTILQTEQINNENSENADNVDNLVTTSSYSEIPLVEPNNDVPSSQEGGNEASSSSANPPNNIETNNNQPTNGIPQQSVNSVETSTQYTINDGLTNIPIQESPNVNVNENAETSTNVPSNSEIPNEINQDSITESELYPTQLPTEKNIFTSDSNKAPDNDATIEVITNRPEYTNNSEINANEVIDEKSSESPQNADKPSTSQTPDYIIDITTTKPSKPLNNIPESIKTEDEVNEVTTYNVDKNNEMTTELYENIQPGVPGEGSCLINFVTYAHKAEVPKSNPCHEKCECLNSIVTCTSVNCPPAPPQHRNCIPLHPGNESWCCPTYMCEGGIEGMLFEGNNQLGSPQLISTVVLEDKPGEDNDEKMPIDEEVPSTSSPQIALEYSSLAPSNSDTNSDVNSQDAISVTEIPTQTEIPNKQIEDSVATNGENIIPVTINNQETTENENDKLVESDHLSEDDKLEENSKPIENNQSAENEKPIDSSEADFTTISYEDNLQTVTNKPETSDNIDNKNTSSNSANESQNYSTPSTEIPNYESTITNILPINDQNQPQSNSELEDTIITTTFKPNDSVVKQQVDDNKLGSNEPTVNEESNTSPVNYVTDLPESNVNPLEIAHIPTIVDDTKPMLNENNANGLRPSSIDDIISSVNMVKDAVKNSLETSSKPIENNYQTTEVIVNHQPTIVPEDSANPPSEDSLPNRFNEPQTTVSSTNIASELQTDLVDEKLTENPTTIQSSNEVGDTQVATSSPSENTDQGVSTDLPQYVPIKQEIPASTVTPNGDINQAEIADDKTPEITTTKYLPNPAEQDLASNGPETSSDSIAPQVNFESNTNVPETAVNDKLPEITTQVLPSVTQQEIHKNDVINKPTEEEKPNTESPISPNSDVNNNNAPADAVTSQVVTSTSHSTTEFPNTGTSDGNDKRFGEPSSTSMPSKPIVQEDNKLPQESGEMVNIPFDTEKPLSKPSSSTPLTPQKPSYTPIPQSTWTQKPFHHDSTSEAPQPDQSFPDEYDDENEAVYGPGTCRYGGKVYVSAQQVPRDDPCDFCFCFRGDIICLQQSCPPPIFGCYQENINGFCCPRYECPVAQATSVNVTTTTTTTTTMVPPHFFANAYRGAARRTGCLIHGHAYRVGEDVGIASGPCLECICGADGKMKCDPKSCSPEPLLRKMMVEAVDDQRS